MNGTLSIHLNARERLQCEHESRRGKSIIRLVRLKPNVAGELRHACQPLEFAARHLPAVIGMLRSLVEEGGAA